MSIITNPHIYTQLISPTTSSTAKLPPWPRARHVSANDIDIKHMFARRQVFIKHSDRDRLDSPINAYATPCATKSVPLYYNGAQGWIICTRRRSAVAKTQRQTRPRACSRVHHPVQHPKGPRAVCAQHPYFIYIEIICVRSGTGAEETIPSRTALVASANWNCANFLWKYQRTFGLRCVFFLLKL